MIKTNTRILPIGFDIFQVGRDFYVKIGDIVSSKRSVSWEAALCHGDRLKSGLARLEPINIKVISLLEKQTKYSFLERSNL